MTRHRVPAATCAALLIALFACVHAPAQAAPPAPSPEVSLSGICPWSEGTSKEASTQLRGQNVLAPYFLYDARGFTGAVLEPYQVTASGDGLDGLKSRHFLPGVYTRPGPAPADSIECTFAGTTPDGAVDLRIVGTVRLVPPPQPRR